MERPHRGIVIPCSLLTNISLLVGKFARTGWLPYQPRRSSLVRPASALAFDVFIVTLVMAGSLWIMANLNHNMMR
jgi:hypothetical protein